MNRFTKLFNTKPASIDDNDSAVTFTISDNQPDRMNERIDQKSWDFTDYKANPIVLWGHDPEEAENVIGTAEDVTTSTDGNRTNATLKFATDINPKAKLVFDMIKAGILRTVSVGFVSGEQEEQPDGSWLLKNNKLLEISVVPIPANPRAIALSYKAGGISQKDARWLIDSMKRETEIIEKQLVTTTKKEKSMTEEEVTKFVEKVAEAVKTEVTTIKEDLVKVVEEGKAKIAELETTIGALKPAASTSSTDTANGGGTSDQSGAATSPLDLEAELTPEQEAEARASLGLEEAAA